MSWKAKGKGGKNGGQSFLQAALEGAVVSALGLAAPPQVWFKGSSKGGGKAKGKTDAAASKQTEEEARLARTCTWSGAKGTGSTARYTVQQRWQSLEKFP